MNYYYSPDGTEISGPYSLEEIKRDLFSGVLPPATQVCAEGTQTWLPLSSLLGATKALPIASQTMQDGKTLIELEGVNSNLPRFHYSYIDKIFKKENGPCDPEFLAHAWFNNRISKESMIHIQELDKTVPLWMIPDFKTVLMIRRKKWKHLLIIAAIAFPLVIMMAKCVGEAGYSVPDLENERRAKQFFADPKNKEIYNEYMRKKRE
jgi:hypothetical protein